MSDINNKWEFTTLSILKNKHPIWKKGWYAFIADELYTWSEQSHTWINTNTLLIDYIDTEVWIIENTINDLTATIIDNFSYENIIDTVNIPVNQQMIVCWTMEVVWELQIEWTLIINI